MVRRPKKERKKRKQKGKALTLYKEECRVITHSGKKQVCRSYGEGPPQWGLSQCTNIGSLSLNNPHMEDATCWVNPVPACGVTIMFSVLLMCQTKNKWRKLRTSLNSWQIKNKPKMWWLIVTGHELEESRVRWWVQENWRVKNILMTNKIIKKVSGGKSNKRKDGTRK